ncbi:MAG: hypothetical protein FJW88_08470 [Actinobacteria bacterium]|nr:hypothetical protein [Actinomycetota bacterium]
MPMRTRSIHPTSGRSGSRPEAGGGWIPHFIDALDDRYWRNRGWGRLPIPEPPSFHWHRNNSASFILDPF